MNWLCFALVNCLVLPKLLLPILFLSFSPLSCLFGPFVPLSGMQIVSNCHRHHGVHIRGQWFNSLVSMGKGIIFREKEPENKWLHSEGDTVLQYWNVLRLCADEIRVAAVAAHKFDYWTEIDHLVAYTHQRWMQIQSRRRGRVHINNKAQCGVLINKLCQSGEFTYAPPVVPIWGPSRRFPIHLFGQR